MSDEPERIVVRVDYDGTHDGTWIAFSPFEPPVGYNGSEPQYVRADRIDALEAENAALKAKLAEAVEELSAFACDCDHRCERMPSQLASDGGCRNYKARATLAQITGEDQ